MINKKKIKQKMMNKAAETEIINIKNRAERENNNG